MAGVRLHAGWLFGDQQAVARDPFLQRGVLGREDDVDAAGDHGDGAAGAAAERAHVRGRVDPAGKAGDDGGTVFGQVQRQRARETTRRRRGVARADHRHRQPGHKRRVAAHDQCRGRVLRLGEQRGIVRLAQEQVARTQPRYRRPLAVDARRGGDRRRRSTAAPGKVGQRVERGEGGAEAGDQLAIGDRADAAGADQAEPRLLLIPRRDQPRSSSGGRPMRGSAPVSSRSMVAPCFHNTISASASSSSTRS